MNSPFTLGALHFGTVTDKKSAHNLMAIACEHQIKRIDTGPYYGNSNSETIIGAVNTDLKNKFKISTKVGLSPIRDGKGNFKVNIVKLNQHNILESVHQSLKRLHIECIDTLVLHAFDTESPLEETLEVINDLIKSGKIRNLGCSNYNPIQVRLLIDHCERMNISITHAQTHYNLIERRSEKKFFEICRENRVPVYVNRALARGALTDKYLLSIPSNSRANFSKRLRNWLDENKLSLIKDLNQICMGADLNLSQVALAWILKRPEIISPILGVRTQEQLITCINSQYLNVSEEIFQRLEVIIFSKYHPYKYPSRYLEK